MTKYCWKRQRYFEENIYFIDCVFVNEDHGRTLMETCLVDNPLTTSSGTNTNRIRICAQYEPYAYYVTFQIFKQSILSVKIGGSYVIPYKGKGVVNMVWESETLGIVWYVHSLISVFLTLRNQRRKFKEWASFKKVLFHEYPLF